MKKFEKGITLIALIITIVVMLILVSLSIRAAIQSGLFEAAGKASQKTATEQAAESNIASGNILINGQEIDINQYISSIANSNINTENWDDLKKVNKPKLTADMQGVYFDNDGNELLVTEENFDNWYDYSNGKWAYAKTTDGILWVWIPRYAYQLTSGVRNYDNATVEIKFLKGNSNYDSNNQTISKKYPTVENGAMTDFVVHPAFTNGTANKFSNGEWDSELEGIWITVELQPYEDIITAYTYSLEYDLNKNSHLIKNSEYGAVMYLQNSHYSGSPILNNSSCSWTACFIGDLDIVTEALDFVYNNSNSTSLKETKYLSLYDGKSTYGDGLYEINPEFENLFQYEKGEWICRYPDTAFPDYYKSYNTNRFYMILCIE